MVVKVRKHQVKGVDTTGSKDKSKPGKTKEVKLAGKAGPTEGGEKKKPSKRSPETEEVERTKKVKVDKEKKKDKKEAKDTVKEVAKQDKNDDAGAKKADTKSKTKEDEKNKKNEKGEKKDEKIQEKKDEKAKQQKLEENEPHRPSALRKADAVPPKRRVSFKSIPTIRTPSPRKELFPSDVSCTSSTVTPPTSSPFSPVSLESIQQWKNEAKARGLSLEDFMEEESRKALEQSVEEHMNALVAEAKGAEDGKEKRGDGDDVGEPSGSETVSDVDSADGNQEGLSEASDQDEDEEKSNCETSDAEDEAEAEGEEEEEEEDAEEFEERLDAMKTETEGQEKKKREERENKKREEEENKKREEEEKQKEKRKETKKEQEKKSEVAAVVSHQKEVVAKKFEGANSRTHKSEWDRFARQCLDRKKFPQSLAQFYVKDKTDLFRQWLACGGEWDKVEVVMARKADKISLNRKQREGMKARDIFQKYPKSKAEKLISTLKSKGLWYYDPDFDKDDEEVYYFVGCGDKIRSDDVTTETTEVRIQDAGNEELAEALITGPLATGMQPATRAATEEGEKNLMQSLHSAEIEKTKVKTPKAEKTEKAEPKTLEEKVAQMMDDTLKKGSEARKLAITLSSLEYSGELSGQLMSFSGKMEKVFRHLRDLQDRKSSTAGDYEKFFRVLQDKWSWYTGAEAAAKALANGLKPKKPSSKAKAKAEKKEKKNENTDGPES